MTTMTWVPAPAGHEGETGSQIPEQAATGHFTRYRTADGYSWESHAPGRVVLPDNTACDVQYGAQYLAPDVAARVRAVRAAAVELKADYPRRPAVGPTPDERLARHDRLMSAMDQADSDL